MLCAAPALARPSAQLRYQRERGAERCPDVTVVRAAVAADLGYDPFETSADRVVVVTVARAARGLEGHIELQSASGEKLGEQRIASPSGDCRELVASLGLAIGLAVDPAALAPTPPSNDEEPQPSAASQPARVLAPEPPPVRPLRPRRPQVAAPLHVLAGGGVHLAVGSAPATTAGGSITTIFSGELFELGLEGRVDFPAARGVADGTIESSQAAVAVAPCLRADVVTVCAVGAVGALWVEGRGYEDARATTAWLATVGGRLAVAMAIGRTFSLRVHAEVAANLAQTSLRLGDEEVWGTPPLAGILGVTILARMR